MKYKLINVRNEVEEDVEFGTCDLCMFVGSHEYTVAVVEDENGNTIEFENGYWSWGSWFTYSYSDLENVIDFADWFSKQDFEEELTEDVFWRLTDEYNEEKETN